MCEKVCAADGSQSRAVLLDSFHLFINNKTAASFDFPGCFSSYEREAMMSFQQSLCAEFFFVPVADDKGLKMN